MKNKTKMDGLITIFGGYKKSKNYINYDYSRLLKAIVFFIFRELKHVEREDILPLYVDFETGVKDDKHQSIMFGTNGEMVVDEFDVFIYISCKNIKEQVDENCLFDSYLKSLFYVILHELYHYFCLINAYKNDISGKTAEIFHNYVCKEKYCKLNNLKVGTYEYYSVWLEIDEEAGADEFALKNLNYFENLYNTNRSLPGGLEMIILSKIRKNNWVLNDI